MNAEQLSHKAAQLKNVARALTAERERLAPLAVNGDARGPVARARIATIDTERSAALSELETIEAALRSPEYRVQTAFEARMDRVKAGFEQRLPRLKQDLKGAISLRYNSLAVDYRGQDIEAIPALLAAELTGEDYCRDNLEGYKRAAQLFPAALRAGDIVMDNTRIIEEATAELAIRAEHTRRLVNSIIGEEPPIPDALKAKLGKPVLGHEMRRSSSSVQVAGGIDLDRLAAAQAKYPPRR